MKKLIDHYHYVKKERAYAMHKAQQAIERPLEVLSIAIDGTDQVYMDVCICNVARMPCTVLPPSDDAA